MEARNVLMVFMLIVISFLLGAIFGTNYSRLSLENIQPDTSSQPEVNLTSQEIPSTSPRSEENLTSPEIPSGEIFPFSKDFVEGKMYFLEKGRIYHLSGKIHGDYSYVDKGKISLSYNGHSFEIIFKVGETIFIENCLTYEIVYFDDEEVIMLLLKDRC